MNTASGAGRLAGIGVLVTRPAGRAAGLSARITGHGGRAMRFPAIDITPPQDHRALLGTLRQLKQVDLVIFVSVHAVHGVAALLRRHRLRIPEPTRVAVVGPESAAQCVQADIRVDFVPDARIDSEGLLEALGGFGVAGKSVVIFRGQSGRDLIKAGLEARGAEVRYVESYRRKVANPPPASLLASWRNREIHALVATSVAVVDALGELLGPHNRALLHGTPIFTYSQRVAAHCRETGFTQIHTAETPDDASLVDALIRWAEESAPPDRDRHSGESEDAIPSAPTKPDTPSRTTPEAG